MENKITIKIPFDRDELYRHSWAGLFTKSGKRIDILKYDYDYYKDNKSCIIGTIEDEDKYNFCVWDEFGKNNNSDCDIYMVRYETPNYDHITEKDIPNTEEFNEKYERSLKYSFKMDKLEYLRYIEFCKDHRDCCKNMGAIGGGIVVSFMGTGLGNIVHAKCECCGQEVDLTNNDNW